MDNIIPILPAIVAQKYHLSEATIKLWKEAAFTVKQAQKKFLAAYEATITDALGKDWKKRWATDPAFVTAVREVEEQMRQYCKEAGMTLTVFNRYRNAARKSALLGVPFNMGVNLTLGEIRNAAASSPEGQVTPEALKAVTKLKKARQVQQQASKTATVLPMPEVETHAEDYLAEICPKLADHVAKVREAYGTQAAHQLISKLVASLAD